MSGKYIVIEGQDATGKDTQAKLLVEFLKQRGEKVVTYAESGTGSENEFIKTVAKLNYGADFNIEQRTHALLYLINRYEQWKKIAEPALKRGETVIVTRNWFSTLVYVGYASGVSRSLITKIHKEIMPEAYFKPDKIVIFTISPEEQVKRLGTQERTAEFWKSKGGEFQKKVNAGYRQVIRDFKVPTLDASGTIEEIQAELRKLFGYV
ncbi:dTMP kinase [Candidatus Saccharibacteria bacterium]|nr:dTMP kinase [Candidatus Saccharibacteria bacterium]